MDRQSQFGLKSQNQQLPTINLNPTINCNPNTKINTNMESSLMSQTCKFSKCYGKVSSGKIWFLKKSEKLRHGVHVTTTQNKMYFDLYSLLWIRLKHKTVSRFATNSAWRLICSYFEWSSHDATFQNFLNTQFYRVCQTQPVRKRVLSCRVWK